MNRIRLFLIFSVLLPNSLFAQINWGDYSQSFPSGALDKPETVALILAIPKNNNSFWAIRENSDHFTALEKDSSFKTIRPSNIVARTTFDTNKAHFFLHGVNKNNADTYEFRITEYPSRKVLIPWQSITQFTDSALIKSAALPQMAYLGGYKTSLGSMLIVDVKKKGQSQIAATCLIAWEAIRPVIAGIYTSDDLDVFLQKLQYPWAQPIAKHKKNYSLDKLLLPATNTNLILVLNADIYAKNQVQYQLIHNNDVRPWVDNEYHNSFIWLKDFSPGQYKIRIRYAVQPQHITEYEFEVTPNWHQSFWFKWVVAGVGVVVIGLLVFIYLLIQQRIKTRQEIANKQKLQLELRALYAQLNPHFVFNALSSIQGLINRHDLKGANEYLSDFARLMRESLAGSSKEEVSLHKELQTMETYLKIEQLRFGFQYTIEVDERMEVYTTNLPSLLWQPLLENAVKHGVAPLQQKGQITVRVEKEKEGLIIQISDNGKGMVVQESIHGFGLKLTRERIALLNQLNQEQPIALAIDSQLSKGTEATLTFNHWFL
jgi:hypothetical protein